MAISCGFYNSVNHDRVYDAVQFGEMFDGLITDGVYETVGNRMMVTTVSGMTIRVRSGRAWFNKTWTVNTGDYPLDIPVADVLLPRIDAVVLEVDTRLETRNNTIKIISGRSASNPVKPTLTRANGLYQYPLAWVTVPANARSITSANIEIQVGRDPTPFVTGVVNQTSISDLWNKWDKEFQDWFDEVRDTLNNTGGNLTAITSRVSSLESKMSNVETLIGTIPQKADSNQLYKNPSGSDLPSNTTYITPYLFKFWWGDATDGRSGKAQASKDEILAGTLGDIYISPIMLKRAFPQLYDGSLGSGSTGVGGSIDTQVGDGTITGYSSFTPQTYTIKYLKIGSLVAVNFAIGFKLNSPLYFTSFIVTGLPAMSQSTNIYGILNNSALSGDISYRDNTFFRLSLTGNIDGNITCVLEGRKDGNSETLASGPTYTLASTFVYW